MHRQHIPKFSNKINIEYIYVIKAISAAKQSPQNEKQQITRTILSVGFGDFPSLNWMIFCVVGRNWLQPVHGDRAWWSWPKFDEPGESELSNDPWKTPFSSGIDCFVKPSFSIAYSFSPWRKWFFVNNNMRPTKSVVEMPSVRLTSLLRNEKRNYKFNFLFLRAEILRHQSHTYLYRFASLTIW